MDYFMALGGAFLITFILLPVLMKISLKIGFTDKPTKRKKHRGPMPLCGGIGIYIGFFIMYFFVVDINSKEKFWIFIGSTLILLIGIFDDSYKASYIT